MENPMEIEEPFAGAENYRKLFIALEEDEGLLYLHLWMLDGCPENIIVRNFFQLLKQNPDDTDLRIFAEAQWNQLVYRYSFDDYEFFSNYCDIYISQ